MTEFKRCTAEIDDLDAAAAKFADHVQWSDDVERAKRDVDTSVAASTSLQVRVGKLLAKAREKDPDRQIYNEKMCQRIEELAARGAQVFARFDEIVGPVNDAHCAWLRQRLENGEYQKQLETTTELITAREADFRFGVSYDERDARVALEEEAGNSYSRSRARQHAREAAELEVELARRAQESETCKALNKRANENADGFIAEAVVGLPRRVISALCRLFDAISADPSHPGVNRLRNLHPALLADFGHPLAIASDATEEAVTAASAARLHYSCFEAVCVAAGYLPSYPNTFLGSCGEGGPGWRVPADTPWAKYGERMLHLQEPSIQDAPDDWMSWHARLQAISNKLRDLAR